MTCQTVRLSRRQDSSQQFLLRQWRSPQPLRWTWLLRPSARGGRSSNHYTPTPATPTPVQPQDPRNSASFRHSEGQRMFYSDNITIEMTRPRSGSWHGHSLLMWSKVTPRGVPALGSHSRLPSPFTCRGNKAPRLSGDKAWRTSASPSSLPGTNEETVLIIYRKGNHGVEQPPEVHKAS